MAISSIERHYFLCFLRHHLYLSSNLYGVFNKKKKTFHQYSFWVLAVFSFHDLIADKLSEQTAIRKTNYTLPFIVTAFTSNSFRSYPLIKQHIVKIFWPVCNFSNPQLKPLVIKVYKFVVALAGVVSVVFRISQAMTQDERIAFMFRKLAHLQ